MSALRTAYPGRRAQRPEGKLKPRVDVVIHSYPSHLQLLDRCLKIVDPELYAHLRSKNLSAEIYAFPCTLYRRYRLAAHNTHLGKCVSHPHALRVYAAFGPGIATLGFPSRFRGTSQRALRYCTTPPYARRSHEVLEVS